VGVPWFGEAEYAIIDLNSHEYDLRSVEFDNDTVKERLTDLGAPPGKFSNTNRL
jgi:hypothetical protein